MSPTNSLCYNRGLTVQDDEKMLFKDGLSAEEAHGFALQNAKDIIACGFDMKKTFIYADLEFRLRWLLTNAFEFSKYIPNNQVRGAFGFDGRLVLPRWPSRPSMNAPYELFLEE